MPEYFGAVIKRDAIVKNGRQRETRFVELGKEEKGERTRSIGERYRERSRLFLTNGVLAPSPMDSKWYLGGL